MASFIVYLETISKVLKTLVAMATVRFVLHMWSLRPLVPNSIEKPEERKKKEIREAFFCSTAIKNRFPDPTLA